MERFEWVRARTPAEAGSLATATVADAMAHRPGAPLPRDAAVFKAGGMDLLDLMKEGLLAPARVVHVGALGAAPGSAMDEVRDEGAAGVSVGALVTLAAVAAHPLLRARYRALSDAAEHSGHPQVRNVATLGGNLAQRPKCWYFRQAGFHCLKKGGEVCHALGGEHQYHAVFGNRLCPIVHPSTAATALLALGAAVELVGPGEADRRLVPLGAFLTPPERDVRRENLLRPGELIAAVRLPALPAGARSAHLKQAERESFDWSVADAACVLERDGAGRCTRAAVALGAAAPVPLRAEAAEAALVGRAVTEGTAREAARLAVAGATPLPLNAYKLPVLEAVVRRAILQAAGA